MNKSTIPESGRLIKLYCDDYAGDYTVSGMFVNYKIPIKKGKRIIKSRFCTLVLMGCGEPEWTSSIGEWKNANSWEYL